MNWNELAKFFITIGGLSGFAIYIAKKLLDKTLDLGIEKFKGDLNIELESFKSNLTRFNTEHQIKYNKLYEQRGERIKELYQIIYELEKRLKLLTTIYQGPEWATDKERNESVREQVALLEETLELNRIYFSDELCAKIEIIIKYGRDIMGKIFNAKLIQKHNDGLIATNRSHLIDNPLESLDKWNEADSFVTEEMPAARLELVKEFHKMIGVS